MEEKRTKNPVAVDSLPLAGGKPDAVAPSCSSLVPLFWRVGLVWLVCALVLLYGEGGDLWSFLHPSLYPVFGLLGKVDILVCSGVKLFLGCFLVVQCVLWQRSKRAGTLSGQAWKVLKGWQVPLVLFCLVYALTAVGIWVGSPLPYVIPSVDGGQSMAPATSLLSLCVLLRSLLPLLVPVLPLLLTGIRGKDRCLTALGVVLLLLYVGYLGMAVAYWVQGTVGMPGYLLYANLVYPILMYLAAPVSLLAVAGRLGRESC